MVDKAIECWAEALDFGTSTELLYKDRRYEEVVTFVERYNKLIKDSPELKQYVKPPKTVAVDKLLSKAAHYYLSKGKVKEMRQVLDRFPDFESKVQFFRQTSQIDEIVGVLIKDNRMDEVRKMYLEQGRFLEAAERGGGSGFDGDCFLGHVMANGQQLGLEESCTFIEKAKDQYRNARDNLGLGDCYLVEAAIRQDDKSVLIGKARVHFQKARCWCGEIEATAARARLSFNSNQDLITAQQAVETAIRLCTSICQSRDSEADTQFEKYCTRFYGLHKVSDSEYAVYPKTRSRFLKFADVETKNETRTEILLLKERVISHLTDHILSLVSLLVSLSRACLMDRFEKSGKHCSSFSVDYTCPKQSTGCPHIHELATSDYWNEKMKNTILATKVELTATSVHDFLRKFKQCAKVVTVIKSRAPLDIFKYFQELVSPLPWQCCLHPLGKSCFRAVSRLQSKPNSAVRKKLLDLVQQAWARHGWKWRLGNINLVQSYWNMFMIVERSDGTKKFLSLLKQDENVFARTLASYDAEKARYLRRRYGDLNLYANAPEFFTPNIVTSLWFDAKKAYSQNNLLEYINTLIKKLLTHSFMELPLLQEANPTLTETNNILETTSYYCLLGLLYLQRLRDQAIFFPQRYQDVAQFWDSVTHFDESTCDFHLEAISDLVFPKDLPTVRGFLSYIIQVILGIAQKRFYVLRYALTRSQCIKSGGAEKTLILCVTLYYNSFVTKGIVDKWNQECLKTSFREILQLDRSRQPLPAHLEAALVKISAADTAEECRRVLEELLFLRNEGLLRVTKTEEERPSFQFSAVSLSNYERPAAVPMRVPVAGPRNQTGHIYIESTDPHAEKLREEEADKFWKKCPTARRFVHDFYSRWIGKWRFISGNKSDRFVHFRVDVDGCRICNVDFKREDAEDYSREDFAERANHEYSAHHVHSKRFFEQYKKKYRLLLDLKQRVSSSLQDVSSDHILEVPLDELRENVDKALKEILSYEYRFQWAEGVRIGARRVGELEKILSDLSGKLEAGSAIEDVSGTVAVVSDVEDALSNFSASEGEEDLGMLVKAVGGSKLTRKSLRRGRRKRKKESKK